MSLQTIIQIGHKIRNELSKEECLQYHRFVKKAPESTAKQPYSYYQIDVKPNFEIDFNSLKEVTDENVIKSKFYYLKYKTGQADNQVKYLFGDIAFPDYFKLGDPTNKAKSLQCNSFIRCETDASSITNEKFISFRSSFKKAIEKITELFKEKQYCYIHFNFQGKCWYEIELFEEVESFAISKYATMENGLISLNAFLTRTLAGSEKVERMINFTVDNNYKNKQFKNIEEFKDLLYGLDFQQLYKVKTNSGEIVINMLPKGDISARGIIEYFNKKSNYDFKNQKSEDIDPFAEPFINPEIGGIEKYDIIFSKPIKYSKPIGSDLLEITDVDQNLLQRVAMKIRKAKIEVDYKYTLDYAIKELFDEKKYTSHLLKILPLIYKDSYYSDDVLLPALIQKTEFAIRNGKGSFYTFNKHYYFLTKLQINDTIMEIKESKSYLLGTKLGIMSKPVTQVIKSFEKAYVGNLSRRIASLNDVVEFSNYLNEKLMIHNKGFQNVKEASRELTAMLDFFKDEKYNRHYCALGFFETYYAYFKDAQTESEIELVEENK